MKKFVSAFLALIMLLSCGMAIAETEVIPMSSVDTKTFTVDPTDPLTSQYFGLYSNDLTMADGTVRQVYQYVPTSWMYRQPEVAVAVPSDADPVAFFESTGWKEASDNGAFAVVLMMAGEGGWQADESEYTMAAFNFMDARTNLQTQDSAFYMVGYGDAANAVMAHAVVNSELFAGFAAFGVDNFDVTVLELGAEESEKEGTPKSAVAVPMWIGAEEKTASVEALIEYWKNANECSDDYVSNSYADEIYSYPEYLAKTNEITYAHVSKVYVTIGEEDVQTPAFTANLWSNFLRRVRRQDSGAINALRYFADNNEMGMDHQYTVVDGVTREYFVYVPEEVKAGEITNVPVVFVAHGGGGSGEEFPARTGWNKTAEEFNFVCVFLTGSTGGKYKASSTWSGADVPFFKAAREFVLANYSVDASRVYFTGHSQGSVMTYNVALQCPELIAAACGNDGIVYRAKVENINDSIVMPFMLNIGEMDKHFIEGGGNYGQVPDIVAEWAARYGIDSTAHVFNYDDGQNYGTDYVNAQGIVVIREQWNKDKIHAMIPNDTYTVWNFLCNYSRGVDGTSYYKGVAIEMN
ncbi:MAG: hypothetical protein MJ136_04195 [Clostridia bacterium]|nr:hypothetical protein [Clostridia bacterium]